MKSLKDIQKIVTEFNVKPRLEMRSKVLDEALEVQRSRKQRSVSGTYIWRMIMKSRITKLTAAAVIIIGILLFFDNSEKSLYAEIMESISDADSLHYIVKTYDNDLGKWKVDHEVIYDHEKGVVEEGYPANKYHLRIDNGINLWDYTPGNNFVIWSQSIGPKNHINRYISGSWPQGKSARDPDGDKVIDGFQCQMFSINEDTKEFRAWVEKVGGKLFLREWESRLLDKNGQWKLSKKGSLKYNVEIPRLTSRFSTDFGPDVKIMDADEIMNEYYGLDKAIFTREIMGLIFAVHEIKRTEEGLIYLSCSLRPTEETVQEFGVIMSNRDGSKVYGELELFSISDGKILYPYKRLRLTEMRYDGIVAKSWFLVPRTALTTNEGNFDVGAVVWTEGELKKQRISEGKPEHKEFKPMATLRLPEDRSSANTIISGAYSKAEHINPITRVRLNAPDSVSHIRFERLENLTEEEFIEAVSLALEELQTN